MDHEESSNLLKHYRLVYLNMSQIEVAGLFGLSEKSYSDLETGKNKCRDVHILAMECLIIRKKRGLLNMLRNN